MSGGVFLIAAGIVCGSIVAIVKTIAAATMAAKGSSSELAALRDQLEQSAAVLEETQQNVAHQAAQIAELHERLDFTERLLAQQRPQAAVGPGGAPE